MLAQQISPPKEVIILRHTPAHWLAEFVGPAADQMRSVYGSAEVPTGFNGCVPAQVVRQAMATLNPNAELVIEERASGEKQAAAPLSLDFTMPPGIAPGSPAEKQPAAPSNPHDSRASALDRAAQVVGQHSREAAASAAQVQPPRCDQSLDFTIPPVNAPTPPVEKQRAAPPSVRDSRSSALDLAAQVVGQRGREAAAGPAQVRSLGTAARAAANVAPAATNVAPAITPNLHDEKQRLAHAALKRAATLRKELGMLVACSYLKEQGWTVEAAHQALNQFCAVKRETARVLVVDDNLDTVHTTALLLRDRGHDVEFAINGIAALFIAQRFRPKVVLLDLSLPDSDGVDIARQLRHHPDLKNVRIIAITGRGGEENRARAMSAGCDEYLMKPVGPSLLVAMIEGSKAEGKQEASR